MTPRAHPHQYAKRNPAERRVVLRELDAMRRVLASGATPQQLADAQAALDRPRVQRQRSLL